MWGFGFYRTDLHWSSHTLRRRQPGLVYLLSTLWVCLFVSWSAYFNLFKPKCCCVLCECQGLITDSNGTFDKAQLGQWKLATDSQRVMSDCLSVSLSRQSMTPSMQHDHINNITKTIQCTDSSFRTLARGKPPPQSQYFKQNVLIEFLFFKAVETVMQYAA